MIVTHHALAEVVGVHARQGAHEEGEDVGSALWVTVVGGDEAAGHADHAAEGGGEGVRLRQGLHGCVGPEVHQRGGKGDEVGSNWRSSSNLRREGLSHQHLLLQDRRDGQFWCQERQVLQSEGCVGAAGFTVQQRESKRHAETGQGLDWEDW